MKHRADMTYQFNPDMLPDTCFQRGELKFVIPGNEARLLDPRRTPLRVLEVKTTSGFFVVEVLDFEDKGARWELPLEDIDQCQFAQGSSEATPADVALYRESISRLDLPLEIPADRSHRAASEIMISSFRERIGDWLERKSAFLKAGVPVDF